MTTYSPRIYIYKITFEEVQYYYYGVHKEKRFGEYYMGSPVTNKWVWDFYTPEKQILQFFEFSDAGYIEASEIENRLIRPFYNTDKWCLNEACGGTVSLYICRKNGEQAVELKTGVHSLNTEKRKEYGSKGGKIAGQKHKENETGICGISDEERSKNGKVGGKKSYELKLGIHGRTKEQRKEDSKKAGKIGGEKNKKNKTGVCGLTFEQRSKNGKKGGKRGGKITASQVWECTITGHRANPGNLSKFQKARGIDTKNRRRIK
jgi:hypothetical protein